MSLEVLLLLALSAVPSEHLQPTMSILFVEPSGANTDPLVRAMHAVLAQELAAYTRIQAAAPAGEREVRGLRNCDPSLRLSCWIRAARPDYRRADLELSESQILPYSNHVAHLARTKVPYPKYLLIVSSASKILDETIDVMLLDTDASLALYHHAPRTEGWALEVERQLFATAWFKTIEGTQVRTSTDLEARMRQVVQVDIKDVLQRSGDWYPNGALLLRGAPGLVYRIGAEQLKTEQPASTWSFLPAGRLQVEVHDPENRWRDTQVDVFLEAGSQRELDIPLVEQPSELNRRARSVTLYGGAGLAAVGAGLVGWSLLAGPSRAVAFCSAPCPDESARFRAAGNAATFGDPRDDDGVLLAPLGYSAILLGSTLAVGTWLEGDEDSFPWLPIVLGLSVGATAYALSALAH